MTKRRFLIYWIETRRSLLLALPITLGQIGQVLLGVVDTVMVGRLGATPLAASALANSLFINFLVFGFGLSSCISILTSRADGAQERRECGEILRHGLVMNTVLSVLMVVLLELLIPLAYHLNQPPEVVDEMMPFLRLMTLSMIPVLIGHSFKTFSEGLRDSLNPMVVMIAAVPLNAALNWILIYGNWGFPAMGLEGAGYATLLTRTICALWLIVLVLRDPSKEPYRPMRWLAPLVKERFQNMLKVGLPTSFQVVFEVGAFSISAVMMGWLGTNALAAHQITINLASLTFMIPMGLSFAVSVRVGSASGAQNWRSARRIGLGAMAVATLFAILFSILFVVGRNLIPALYIDDPEVLALSAHLFLVAGAFQLVDGIQVVAVGALRGLLDMKIPTVVTFIAYWVLALPLGYVFGFIVDWKSVGVWAGLSLGLAFAAVLLGLRFLFLSAQKIHEARA